MAFQTIRSASGVDFIGTDEADVLVAFNESGNVYVGGRASADTIIINQPASGVSSLYTIQGGQGNDAITFNSAVSNSLINGNLGNDVITTNASIAQTSLFGGGGDDTLNVVGGAVNSTVSAGDGNDTVNAWPGQFANTLINGNAGNDTINLASTLANSSYTSVRVLGGEDNDTISDGGFLTTYNNVTINGNKGLDVITLTGAGSVSTGLSVFGGEGSDTITVTGLVTTTGSAAGVYVSGDLGNDNILTGAGADTVLGGAGDDNINSGAGNDTVTGGAGNDTITGGLGTNRIIGGLGADTFNAGGTDTFVIQAIADSQATVSGTVQGFDSFGTAAFNTTIDKLNISAVSATLAGGNVAAVNVVGLVAIATAANFADLKTALDGSGAAASSVAGINAYTFTVTAGALAGNYLWINDSQAQYNQGDLMFNIGANAFVAGDITI